MNVAFALILVNYPRLLQVPKIRLECYTLQGHDRPYFVTFGTLLDLVVVAAAAAAARDGLGQLGNGHTTCPTFELIKILGSPTIV